MAGPGGVERGRISIRVLPNTAQFARSLERYLNRIEKRLQVVIPVHLDDSAISREMAEARAKAKRAAREVDIPVGIDPKSRQLMERQVDSIGKGLAQRIRNFRTIFSATVQPIAGFLSSLARIAVVGGVAATALVGGAGLVGAVTALGAALAGAAPAAAVLVPGLATLLTLTSTLKVGLLGVGDALSDAIGKDTFAKVSPQAERFVKAVKGIVPQLVRVKNTVQDRLFGGLADEVRPLAERYLPLLERSAAGVASTLNGALRRGLDSVNTAAARSQLAGVLEAARRSLSRFAPLVSRLPGLLLSLAATASPAFERLGATLVDKLGGAMERLSRSISAGTFSRFLDDALAVVGDLFRTLGSVLGVITGIGKAAQTVFGTQLTSPLAAAAKALDRFINSAKGQRFLTGLFEAAKPVLDQLVSLLGDVAGAVGDLFPVAAQLAGAFLSGLKPVVPVVERIGRALGPALAGVLPGLSSIAQSIGGVLADALETLGPVLPIIADGLAGMASAVSGGLSAFFTTLAPILPGIAEAFAGLAISLGDSLAQALIDLAPKLPDIADAFIQLAGGLAQITPQLLDAIVNAFVQLAPQLPEVARSLADIVSNLADLAPLLGPIVGGITALGDAVDSLPAVPTGLFGIQLALNQMFNVVPGGVSGVLAALSALPGQAGSALAGLVPALTVALSPVAAVIRATVGSVPGVILGILAGVPGLILSALAAVGPNVRAVFTAAVTATRQVLGQMPGSAAAAVAPTVGRVLLAVVTLPAQITLIAVRAIVQFVAALARGPEEAGRAMAGIGPAVVTALDAIGGQAFSAGARIVSSIASGIASRIGEVTGAMARIGRGILGNLPGSPVKEGPLTVLNQQSTNPGAKIVQMLADGMAREARTATSAAALTAGLLAAGLDTRPYVPDLTAAPAGPAAGRTAPLVEISGDVYTTDVDEMARTINRRQADALALYSIGSLAATGG